MLRLNKTLCWKTFWLVCDSFVLCKTFWRILPKRNSCICPLFSSSLIGADFFKTPCRFHETGNSVSCCAVWTLSRTSSARSVTLHYILIPLFHLCRGLLRFTWAIALLRTENVLWISRFTYSHFMYRASDISWLNPDIPRVKERVKVKVKFTL